MVGYGVGMCRLRTSLVHFEAYYSLTVEIRGLGASVADQMCDSIVINFEDLRLVVWGLTW